MPILRQIVVTELLHPFEKVFRLGDSLVIGIVHSLKERKTRKHIKVVT